MRFRPARLISFVLAQYFIRFHKTAKSLKAKEAKSLVFQTVKELFLKMRY